MKIRLWFAILTSFSLSGFAMEKEQAVDHLMSEVMQRAPGASLMVIKEGKPVLAKAYGWADLEHKIPCTTNTNFRLASVTKQFTAMCILILAERHNLSLDDRMTKFFPEFPAYGDRITLRHLLTHTSGLLDYEEAMPKGVSIPLSDRDVLWIMLHQDHLKFLPGEKFDYSNTGYSLLALVVEAASGEKFAHFLHENIFSPLEMTRSLAYEPGVSEVKERAFGYLGKTKGFKSNDQSLTSSVLGDGGIYSSVSDLFKWDQSLYTKKLVSGKLLAEAFRPHSNQSDFDGSGYGFGWYLGTYRGTKMIWHYGSTCGFATKIERFPEKKLSVILLTNGRDAKIGDTPKRIADLFW